MLRDRGSHYSVGYGRFADEIPADSDKQREGNPEGGILSKALDGHPVMRFLAYATATMVGMHIAGKAIKSGGVKLAAKWGAEGVEHARPWQTSLIKDVRATQKLFDEWQGVTRHIDDVFDFSKDKAVENKGFFLTEYEKRKVAREGMEGAGAVGWSWKDEIRQSMLKQARRLPYELPAAYVTQRAVVDPLIGHDPNKKRPKWYNPIGVLGDFAQQSVANLSGMLLPLDAGGAGARQGWRRMMSMGDDLTLTGVKGAARKTGITASTWLELVGQDASEVLYQASKYSQKTTGAFSTAIHEGLANSKGLVQHLNEVKNARSRNRWRDMRPGDLFKNDWQDVKFGPFGGTGTFFRTFGRRWSEIGNLLEQREKYLAGVKGVEAPPYSPGGGYSTIERMGRALDTLGKGGPDQPGFVRGEFYRQRSRIARKQGLTSPAAIRRQVDEEWNKFYQQSVVPWADKRLKSAKLPFEQFAYDPDPEGPGAEHIIREVATKIGLPNAKTANIQSLARQAENYGIDINDPEQIRQFFVANKVVHPPWRKEGYNLFGVKPLTLAKAQKIGYFDSLDPSIKGHISQLIGDLDKSDPVLGNMSRLTVGSGVLETRSGKILDFSPLLRSFRRGRDVLADSFQIPLLHIPPLKVFGESARRAYSEGPIIQMTTGANQFVPGVGRHESLAWMGKSSSRGTLARIGTRVTNQGWGREPYSEAMGGIYKSMSTDAVSMLGRHARLAVGDKGNRPSTPRGRLGRLFNIDEDQPQSIFRWAQAFAHRQTDINNPTVFARKVLQGGFEGYSEKQVTQGYRNFVRDVRKYQMGSRVLRHIEGMPGAEDLYSIKVGAGKNARHVSLAGVRDAEQMSQLARSLIKQDDPQDYGMFGGALRGAQNRIQGTLDQASEAGFFDKPAPERMRKAGIHRRLDVFRAELYRYLATRKAVVTAESARIAHGGEEAARTDVIGDLLSAVDDLRTKHMISGKEFTEARASILSMQVDLSRATLRDTAGKAPSKNILATIGSLQSSKHGRALLSEYANLNQVAGEPGTGPFKFIKEGFTLPVGGVHVGGQRDLRRMVTIADREFPGEVENPFGENERAFAPIFRTAAARHPLRAAGSVLGVNTWSDPEAFSTLSVPQSHFFERLNRYFSTFGLGLDASKYKGPLHYYTSGIIGRRVAPAVIGGTALLAADATLGGALHRKDRNGDRVYSPMIGGGIAKGIAYGQAIGAGITPGGQTYQEKKQELFEGDVPVRRGRWWPLGNTPWKGDRIQYYRPSWYRRFTSGYKYTDQTYGSPLERLAFYHDFSPLRPFDPYRFERKHYEDRPYPVTGDYFTGPWGPLTSMMNLTAGRVLKPKKFMHKEELQEQLSRYQTQGAGTGPPPQLDESARVLVRTAKRQSVQIPMAARGLLGQAGPFQFGGTGGRGGGSYLVPGAAIGGGGGGGGGPATVVAGSVGGNGAGGQPGGAAQIGVSGGRPVEPIPRGIPIRGNVEVQGGASISRQALNQVNQFYEYMGTQRAPLSRRPAMGTPVMTGTNKMKPRLMANAKPVDPRSMKYQMGELGYNTQELFGIYGFLFGTARNALGFGTKDFSPRKPVLTSASRAYGSERSFWDLNLGGAGDFPMPFEGEYGNVEISEIARRFVPHRRRDINEVNPIANRMGRDNPWLPGSDYFINFKQGDPYALVNEGEMRLPGKAYERFNQLHSDATGRYGLVDKFKILGDIAPYSDQYKALAKTLQQVQLSPKEQDLVRTTKKQVSSKKKVNEFTPYRYAHQSFVTEKAKITGLVPGRADQFYTDLFGERHPVRLSGVRARRANEAGPARDFMSKFIQSGDTVNLTMDSNRTPAWGPTGTIDAYLQTQSGVNVNKELAKSGYGKTARVNSPLDAFKTEGFLQRRLKALGESIRHRNTLLNTKFMPGKTATEDWERRNVYGATFPQWEHPIRDFLKPLLYRSANRDPITGTLALAAVGSLFGANPPAKRVGALIGGAVGLGTSLFTSTNPEQKGQRFIPKFRRQELAVEEYTDILNYVKYSSLYSRARSAAIHAEGVDPEKYTQELKEGTRRIVPLGPITQQALQYRQGIKRTMYGADPFGDVMDLYAAIPKRKRKHFMEFLHAPARDRPRILSTAGRLERRIYEARWGLKVEKRPDLVDYFSERELPPPDWEGWMPGSDMDTVKLKIAQHMGLDASQMGYYPQQVKEANLQNPSYPDFFGSGDDSRRVLAQLQAMLREKQVDGNVRKIHTPYPGTYAHLHGGVQR